MIKETKFLGLGGAGSKLVNELYNINHSANIGFINSNANEMKILNNYTPSNGLFIDGNGTGRNRQKAMESLKASKEKILNFVEEDTGKYTTYVIITSLDGGFGSGSFPMVSKLIKNINIRYNYNVDVNLIGVVPKNNSRKINLNNTLTAYSDIVNLKNSGIINSYQFINNNKMIKEKEFNTEIMDLINKSYTINNNELDLNDAKLINSTIGYKMVLELDKSFSGKLSDAINYSFANSCFLVPKNIGRCKKFGCSFVEDDFDKNEVLDKFNITEFDKEDYNDNDMNLIVMGGMSDPIEYFKNLEDIYNSKEDEIDELEEYIPKVKSYEKQKTNIKVKEEIQPKKLTKKDLRNMIDDLW